MEKDNVAHHGEHKHTLYEELICHLPYAIFSVAFGLALLSLITLSTADATSLKKGSHVLFHSFHFMHIIFAATGSIITYLRFSRNYLKALAVGIFTSTVFCTLSDAVLPYLGGEILGVNMHFHLCFISELANVLPFLFIGLINGFIMSGHHQERQGLYSRFSHAIHILISSLASIFYLVSNGFIDWQLQIGFVFLFLVIAVVVPCTFSDVVVPMMVAKTDKKR